MKAFIFIFLCLTSVHTMPQLYTQTAQCSAANGGGACTYLSDNTQSRRLQSICTHVSTWFGLQSKRLGLSTGCIWPQCHVLGKAQPITKNCSIIGKMPKFIKILKF